MLARINILLLSAPRAALLFVCIGAIALLGAVDHVTRSAISMSAFYLVPVGVAAWYGRERDGVFLVLLSAAVWSAARRPGPAGGDAGPARATPGGSIGRPVRRSLAPPPPEAVLHWPPAG